MHKILFSFLVISITVFPQLDRSIQPQPGSLPDIKLAEAETFELDNGLKVFVVENNKFPQVSFILSINRDLILEEKSAGFVELAGELLSCGTTNMTKDELDHEIDKMGAIFNTWSNGVYLSSLSKYKDKTTEILSEIAFNSSFRQEELDRLKKQKISIIKQSMDEPNSIARNIRKAVFFGKNHPYGEIATEETISSIKLSDCSKYYSDFFVPNISAISIVGDITVDEAKELINKYFSKWQRQSVPTFSYEKKKRPAKTQFALFERPNSVQANISVGYPVEFRLSSPDYFSTIIMENIFGGSFTSRLNKNLRENKGYTYGAFSNLNQDLHYALFYAGCEARNSVTDSVIIEIFSEMKKLKEVSITEEELEKNKNYIAGSFIRNLENPETIANFALNCYRYYLPDNFYSKYLKNLFSVTVSDIKDAANKYLKPDNSYIVIIGKTKDIENGLLKLSENAEIKYFNHYGQEISEDASIKLPPASEIIDKHIKALGGRTHFQKIKDLTVKYSGNFKGLKVSFINEYILPNKLKTQIDAGMFTQITIVNKDKAIRLIGDQRQGVSPEESQLLSLSSNPFAFLNFSKNDVKLEVAGIENVKGKKAYKVFLILKSDIKLTNFYDSESGLLVKQLLPLFTPQGVFESNIQYYDYKKVNGLIYPHRIVQNISGETVEMILEEVKINKGLKEEEFEIR